MNQASSLLLDRDPQLPQLPLADRRRRVHHQIHGPRGLRERINSPKLFAPARIMTIRSSPSAIPPCGGVPYSSASRKNPKRDLASSSLMPSALKIFRWI